MSITLVILAVFVTIIMFIPPISVAFIFENSYTLNDNENHYHCQW